MDLAQQILQKNDIKEKQVIIHRAAGRITVVCGMRIESSVAQRRKWHEKMIFTPPSLPNPNRILSSMQWWRGGFPPSFITTYMTSDLWIVDGNPVEMYYGLHGEVKYMYTYSTTRMSSNLITWNLLRLSSSSDHFFGSKDICFLKYTERDIIYDTFANRE